MKERLLKPELLDHLDAADPDAVASRRDLRMIHRLMGHGPSFRSFFSDLFGSCNQPIRVVELGAGDGMFLAQHLPSMHSNPVLVLVDRVAVVDPAALEVLRSKGWSVDVIQADVFEALEDFSSPPFDLVFANLFLHHFSDVQLADLLARLSTRANAFLALEPRRSRFAWLAAACLPLLGCNRITRYDSKVSVAAGFRLRELAALWPSQSTWIVREDACGLFSHRFTAIKNV